jgi:hypothetical protein
MIGTDAAGVEAMRAANDPRLAKYLQIEKGALEAGGR